ncbi:MAG: DMT family transporter [Paracoccaceae bacterium]|nr:DMT family transporter [Paracoccaceae bacterium]
MSADRPSLGIALMLGFCLAIPFADAFAKMAGATLPLAMLLAARFAIQAVAMAGLALLTGARLAMERGVFALSILRAILNLFGLGAIYGSFRFLPLADAVAIAYVLPFILLFLGYFFMGEEVGARRVMAALVGFAGTLMVVQPSFAAVGPAALLPVAAAVIFAFYIILTRHLAQTVNPMTLQAASGWQSLAILLPAMAVGAGLGIDDLAPVRPDTSGLLMLLAVGGFGTLAHLLMTLSLRYAPSATVAPVQYLEIPVAAGLGWVFFREFPNGLALAGILVILAAGLYIVLRERRLSRLAGPQAVRRPHPGGG